MFNIPKAKDITGMKSGRLTVVGKAPDYIDGRNVRRSMWECRCECGGTAIVRSDGITRGTSRSCGCLQKEHATRLGKKYGKNKKHGLGGTRINNIWLLMRHRCNNPNNEAYVNYGARGIKVCQEWDNDDSGMESFYQWAIESGYNDDLTIERINNDSGYSPSNCMWIPKNKQALNTRKTLSIEYKGITDTGDGWCRRVGLPKGTVATRLGLGWSVADAIEVPLGVRRKRFRQ